MYSDPYVKVRLYNENKIIGKWKSSIKHKTLVPVYNEAFQFDIPGNRIANLELEILIMDHDRFSRDDVIGVIRLGNSVEGESEYRHWNETFLRLQQNVTQWHSVKDAN